MNGLTQYGNAGIFYNTHIFSEELVAEFLAPPKPPTSVPTPVPVPLGIKTPDEAFALAWSEMIKEEEFVKAIEEGQYTSAQFLSNFKEQRSTPLTPEELARMKEIDIKRLSTNDRKRGVWPPHWWGARFLHKKRSAK